MTIEDVQYLLQNSVEDSQRFYLDSDKRNREFYPTPSEYVIDFPDPFRNVFGIEILDGTIPSSMYNIDYHNNTFRLIKFGKLLQPYTPPFSTHQLLSEVGDSPRHQEYLDAVAPQRLLVVERSAYDDAAGAGFVAAPPADEERQGILSSEYAFFVRNVVKNIRMQKDVFELRNDSRYATFTFQEHLYAVNKNSSDASELVQALASRASNNGNNKRDEFVVRVAGRDPQRNFNKDAVLYDVIWFDVIETVKEELERYINRGHSYVFDVAFVDKDVNVGNYTLEQFQSEVRKRMREEGITVESTTRLSINQTHRFRFVSDSEFVFDMEHSSLREALGFSQLAGAPTVGDTYESSSSSSSLRRRRNNAARNRAGTALKYGNNKRVFGAEKLGPEDSESTYQIASPGIINLRGVRYIKLRVPEIEDYMNDRANFSQFGTGLGVFVLGNRNEVNNIRFDFVSVKNRNIHPIGKLSRLTFRFEMPDGNLYDFKGIDHQLLVNLKMWAPTPSKNLEFKGSVLNQEYNPDIQNYMNNQFVEVDDDNNDEYDDVYNFMNDPDDPKVDDTRYDYPEDETRYSDNDPDDQDDAALMQSFALARRTADHLL